MSCPVVQPRGQGERSTVVARGMRRDRAIDFLLPQAGDRVACAPELEGSRALQVLTFEIETAAQGLIQTGVIENRCQPYAIPDPGMRQVDIGYVRNVLVGIQFHF